VSYGEGEILLEPVCGVRGRRVILQLQRGEQAGGEGAKVFAVPLLIEGCYQN